LYSNLFGFEKKICLELSNVVGLTLVRSTSIQITYVEGPISSRSTANNYGKLGVPSSNADNMLEQEDSVEEEVEYIFRSFDNREAVLDILKQLHTAALHGHGNGHETPVPNTSTSATATATRMTRSIRSDYKPLPFRSGRKSKLKGEDEGRYCGFSTPKALSQNGGNFGHVPANRIAERREIFSPTVVWELTIFGKVESRSELETY
jgi:hypothetical protein